MTTTTTTTPTTQAPEEGGAAPAALSPTAEEREITPPPEWASIIEDGPNRWYWRTANDWRGMYLFRTGAVKDARRRGYRIAPDDDPAERHPANEGDHRYPEDAAPEGCRRVDYPDGSGAYETPPPPAKAA